MGLFFGSTFVFFSFSLASQTLSFLFVDGLLMSLAIGVVSKSESMGFDDKGNEGAEVSETHHAGKTATDEESGDEEKGGTLRRYRSESSIAATEDEDDDEERKIELGPQCTLKEQLEKDKVGVCLIVMFLLLFTKILSFSPFCLIYVLVNFLPLEALG